MTYVRVLSQEMILLLLAMTSGLVSAGKHWDHNQNHHLHDNLVEERAPKSHISRLDVVCSKDHMTVHMFFEDPFYGVVFSHSSPNHERCVHVGPRAGVKEITFHISYDSCGTVEDLSGQFHENTIVIQYGEDILEAWDEAKRLRCEWLESFDKKSSKPVVAISDIETVELNFQGDDIDCWMEVQEGKGPWARQVGGLVPIGSPLTLVIAVNDNSREFDMRVKQCTASDGTGSEIQLTDQSGCVLRPSLLTPFAKIRDFGGKATLVAYSHLFAFKFPDNLDVFVHCIVEVCRHGCPESCGGRSPTDYHPHLRENLHSLESKKHQKLVQLTKSKPSLPVPAPAPAPAHVPTHAQAPVPVQHEEVPHNRPRLQYLTQVPVHILQKSKSGSDTSKELILLAEQQLRQQTLSRNASTSLFNKDISNAKHVSVGSNFRGQTGEAQISKKPKYEIQSSPSNIHIASEETKSHTSRGFPDVKPVPIGHYHKIIGHDAHWNSEEVKLLDEQHFKHHIPPVKSPSIGIPQPEPSAWSADEVKTLTKDEVFNPHVRPKIIDHHHIHLNHEISKLTQVPQPEPAAWSADEVKPLTKDEVFNPHTGLKTIDYHHIHLKHEVSKLPQIPQPEPAAWSADDVKPLTKQEVFRHHISEHHINNFKEELGRLALSKEIIDEHRHSIPNIPLIHESKPEPAPWTYDEVGPMHNPGLLDVPLEKERLQEPRPEPAPWTADEVRPISKEDLKVHSLNYKLKTHLHQSASFPTYKESVHPHKPNPPSPAPVPVYVPKYTPSVPSMPMSGPMMMKMMMTMPTLLPFTYQTARWPQKSTTGRHLRTDKQHYPYPIPQFTHRQQMMMSVIADRRMDGDDGELQFELDPRSHMNLSDHSALTEMYEKLYLLGTVKPEETTATVRTSEGKEKSSGEGHELSNQKTSATVSKDPSEISTEGSNSRKNQSPESSGAVRPPISDFVQPSLDSDELSKHESSDRSVHMPRALDRRKRSSEPVFGVKQKFQAIALSDLAFDLNLTRDSTAVFKGRREEIIYGICMSPASMSAGVGFILILILCSLIASLMLYEHSYRLRNKTSHLLLLTRTFNGRLEPLYRITRPHPNSNIQEIG
ncbi:ZP domain-containing protein [Nephila pilipes]|uniref:ZP domain-containing protein n=1 Tax=Nephila pilipes TaxID=299642 RepID=A0A8X6P586_NEPPI|nr:ZP domain-containing protein [Nephila pilipes]